MRTRLLLIQKLPSITVVFMLITMMFLSYPVSAAKMSSGEEPPISFEDHDIAYMPDQVIVKFMRGKGIDSINGSNAFKIIDVDNTLPFGFTRLWIDGDVSEACYELTFNPDIELAEPNYIRYAQRTPNDPLFYRQDNLKLSNAELAWNIQVGDPSVIVAVIDTGCDINHPDLKGNLLPGANFRESGKDESDDSGHGTAVTGVVAAVGNNAEGIAGAAWTVKVLPLRACGGQGLTCNVVDEAKAIQEAIVQGAHIINLSLGGFGKSTIEETAINDAWAAGIVILAAAGNHGLLGKIGDPDTESNINYPAGYANVIGVGSVDYPQNGNLSNINRSEFSNYGDAVSVTAVGKSIITTAPSVDVPFLIFNMKADYGQIDGTSFSTPLVSGMAAIIKSHFPNITNVELRAKIESSVIDIGPPGWDNEFGYGLVDFQKALLGSTHASNSAFNFGITTNPILNDDIILLVKVKSNISGSPSVTYTYYEEGQLKSGSVQINKVPNLQSVWSGNFSTLYSGSITFKVNGVGSGGNLPELQMEYFKGRSN